MARAAAGGPPRPRRRPATGSSAPPSSRSRGWRPGARPGCRACGRGGRPERTSTASFSIFIRPPRPWPSWRRAMSRSSASRSSSSPAGRPSTIATSPGPCDSPAVVKLKSTARLVSGLRLTAARRGQAPDARPGSGAPARSLRSSGPRRAVSSIRSRRMSSSLSTVRVAAVWQRSELSSPSSSFRNWQSVGLGAHVPSPARSTTSAETRKTACLPSSVDAEEERRPGSLRSGRTVERFDVLAPRVAGGPTSTSTRTARRVGARSPLLVAAVASLSPEFVTEFVGDVDSASVRGRRRRRCRAAA